MTNRSHGLSPELHDYLLRVSLREPDILRRLREETAALEERDMQIAPEQGAFMGLLVELIDARRCLEVGTFTGYSSLAVALRLPAGASLVCCDVSEQWTSVARRYWREAGVDDLVELRLAPALETLDALLLDPGEATFDFAFVDAAKHEYVDYHERVVRLLRTGGIVLYDNVFWDGAVLNPAATDADTQGVRALNEVLAGDERVSIAMVPIADGVTIARKR